MKFVRRDELRERFAGKSVALIGSGPGSLENPPGLVDSHNVVVRVNNYKCVNHSTGFRTDVHYSFYGTSIKKTAADLKLDGVTLCVCKCPNAKALESEWHRKNNKPHGVDFRYIYRQRRSYWFCDTYVPPLSDFLDSIGLLCGHIPTTGFSALLLVLSCDPARVFLTGFDFFTSGVHNVNEPWRAGNPADPIGHAPERERAWIAANRDRLTFDARLHAILES